MNVWVCLWEQDMQYRPQHKHLINWHHCSHLHEPRGSKTLVVTHARTHQRVVFLPSIEIKEASSRRNMTRERDGGSLGFSEAVSCGPHTHTHRVPTPLLFITSATALQFTPPPSLSMLYSKGENGSSLVAFKATKLLTEQVLTAWIKRNPNPNCSQRIY